MTEQPTAITIDPPETVHVTLVTGGVGPVGPPGPEGKSGTAAGSYVHTQGVSSNKWTVVHKLGKYPSVLVQDTANSEVEGDIEFVDTEQLIITFSAAFAGKAYVN